MFKSLQSLFCILHPASVLLSVCSLHFTLTLHFTLGPQSAVRSPQSTFYTDRFPYPLQVRMILICHATLKGVKHEEDTCLAVIKRGLSKISAVLRPRIFQVQGVLR